RQALSPDVRQALLPDAAMKTARPRSLRGRAADSFQLSCPKPDLHPGPKPIARGPLNLNRLLEVVAGLELGAQRAVRFLFLIRNLDLREVERDRLGGDE